MTRTPPRLNWLDRAIASVAPGTAVNRMRARAILDTVSGFESSEETRKRRFHRNILSGDELARAGAVALRNQARHLERNHDIARGIIDKLVDFSIGPSGVMVEPQPKTASGEIHDDYARQLEADFAKWSEWPEVTWVHDRGAMERLAARTWYRDGEVFGQLVSGARSDLVYGSDVPLAIEMIEPDMLPHDWDDLSRNLRQGIERNQWGRPRAYHFLTQHPGDRYSLGNTTPTVRRDAERILHVRNVDRIGQLRGITVLASVIATLQDLWEYEDAERIAAKMAASLVLKITRGDAAMWGADGNAAYDPEKPPVYQMDGGMVVVNSQPGEDSDLFDTKRPNVNAATFVNGQLRRVAGGTGLTYSAVARDYNGTYSAQRQELVENWPHYHALTGTFVAQWSRPAYQEFARWHALTHGVPAGVDRRTIGDAVYLGPPMPWIDPKKEAEAQIMLVQACFKTSAAVMRERGNNWRDTYKQLEVETKDRADRGLRFAPGAATPDETEAANPPA